MTKPEFGSNPIFYKLAYMLGSNLQVSLIYVSGFIFGEASMLAAGFGY